MAVEAVQLRSERLRAFEEYMVLTESKGGALLMPCHLSLDREMKQEHQMCQMRKGTVLVGNWDKCSKNPIAVSYGLIHDWIGSAFIPGRSVQQVLALIQDYDNHKVVYCPEVIESKLLERSGNDFVIYLRLMKHKVITVVLDTYHNVHYSWSGEDLAFCHSRTTQILEIDHAGTPKGQKGAPDTGHGFLWRLYTYWRFEQMAEGVFVKWRAVSLTRDIPAVLRLVIKPILQSLPKELLAHSRRDTTRPSGTMIRKQPTLGVERATFSSWPEPSVGSVHFAASCLG